MKRQQPAGMDPQDDNGELRARLAEAEDALRAIREGEVDAIIVTGSQGNRLFTLAETENIYRLMVETMNEAGVALTPDGVILFANHRLSDLLKRPVRDLIARDFRSFLAAEDQERFARLVEDTHQSPAADRITLIAADGTLVPLFLWASTLAHVDGSSVSLVGTDLTQLESSQKLIHQLQEQALALRESEERFRTVADFTYDWEYWRDEEGRCIYLSPSVERLTGHGREEVLADPNLIEKLIHPDDREVYERHVAQCHLDGVPGTVDFRIIRPDGRCVWIAHNCQPVTTADGRPRGHRGSNRDITDRKEMEQALQASQARFESLAAQVPSVLMRFDRTLRVRYLSKRAEFFTGIPIEQFLGRTNRQVGMPDELCDRWDAAIEDVFRTGLVQSLEFELAGPSGNRTFFLVFSPEYGTDGRIEHVLGVTTDITDRKRIDELTRLQSNLVDSVSDAIVSTDLDFRITSWNRAAETIYGWSAAEALGQNATDLLSPRLQDGRPYVDARKELLEKRFLNSDVLHRRKDGKELRLLANENLIVRDGQPIGYVGVYHDLTERFEVQETLRYRDEQLRLASESAGVGMWSWDLQANSFSSSPQMSRLCGLSHDDPLYPDRLLSAIHSDDHEAFQRASQRALTTVGEHEQEFRVIWPDGAVRWLLLRGRTEPDAEGKPLRNLGVMLDITERRRATEELRLLNESLEEIVAERTFEIQQLANRLRRLAAELSRAEQRERRRLADILHDYIQQLLVAARMQIEWATRTDDPVRIRPMLLKTDSVLKEAIDASRSLTVELSPPVLHEAGLCGGLSWLAERMSEKHRLAVHLQADSQAEPRSEEVRLLLFECVRELLFNIVKHAGVTEAHVTLDRLDGRMAQIVVADRGRGFDAGRWLHSGRNENSFGLFSIQQRLDHIGGSFEIQSVCGQGTDIRLTAPLSIDADVVSTRIEPRAATTAASAAQAPGSCLKVLIVDDHQIVREGLAGLLQPEPDIRVVGQAGNGETALKLAAELQPDVIIMDVNLGDMSGIDVTRSIVERNPRARVVGLTMYIETQIAAAMRNAGAETCLPKDIASDVLLAAIRQSGRGAHDNQPAPRDS